VNNGMEAALVAARLVQFAAAFVLLGAPVLALALAWRFDRAALARRDLEAWLARWLPVAAAAAIASGLAWLDLEAAIMGNGWAQAVDPGTIQAVLFDTVFGRAWCWHLGFAALALGAAVAARWPPHRGAALALLAAVAAAHVASLAWAGHALMHPGAVHVLVQAVHVLVGALWLGSLPALYYLVQRAQRETWRGWEEALRYVLPLYSRAGYGAVGLILLTGVLNSVFLLGGAGSLVTTLYGRVLLTKICLVLVMVGLAIDNRFVLGPQIASARPGADRAIPLARLARSVAAEQGLGVLILSAVSLLGILPPG
jgi:putative copper resistance protein D